MKVLIGSCSLYNLFLTYTLILFYQNYFFVNITVVFLNSSEFQVSEVSIPGIDTWVSKVVSILKSGIGTTVLPRLISHATIGEGQ